MSGSDSGFRVCSSITHDKLASIAVRSCCQALLSRFAFAGRTNSKASNISTFRRSVYEGSTDYGTHALRLQDSPEECTGLLCVSTRHRQLYENDAGVAAVPDSQQRKLAFSSVDKNFEFVFALS
ncbi:hypothetical protein L596_009443 [Steinernema carpocapsae]|uniref:Uncharacterized protein n=1 Tax=Steinernema carpocapsae TaxID=34508 RepID=A0A4U5PFN1_STECR|nr:hypothetical protein L596_009443 [Steinernema carpocapsae]